MLFAALYYLDVIHLLLDVSGRSPAQMTNVHSHSKGEEDYTKGATQEQNKEEENIFMSHFKARKITHPFISAL